MRKYICLTTILLLTGTILRAQEPSRMALEASPNNAERISVTLCGVYGWNETWKSHGGVDAIGYFPVNKHFEATASAEYLSPKVFSATVTARPKFPLKVGEIFLDGSIHYRLLGCYATSDFTLAASAGYRMDYVSVQVGLINHTITDLDWKENSTSEKNIHEPFNLLYRVSFNVRPAVCRWNVGAGAANYTDFEYERSWEPMFFLHGHYDIDNHFTVLLRGDLKPAGAFHLNANFWGIAWRAGVKYTF